MQSIGFAGKNEGYVDIEDIQNANDDSRKMYDVSSVSGAKQRTMQNLMMNAEQDFQKHKIQQIRLKKEIVSDYNIFKK